MAIKANIKLRRSMSAETLSWDGAEAYLAEDDRIILPVGAQEQHGRHLPLAVDWLIPWALGRFTAAETGVFCSSPLCYGMSWLHSGFPGTVFLKPTTLIAVYTEVLLGLHRQGFRRILLLNGHGGNGNALNAALGEVVQEAEDLRVKVEEWWRIPPVVEISEKRFGQIDSHAGPAESSVMLELFPESVDMARASDDRSELLPSFPSPARIRRLYPDGVMQSDATRASVEAGREIIAACLAYFAARLDPESPLGAW
ncbi:MAG: creatininase family protein [Myxococcota bacterium]|nr:creatininase family protein [Myxococcota bacterium]